MSETVSSAVVTGCFGLLTILLTYMLSQQRKTTRHVSEVREQVQNTHSTNLRDDIDGVNHNVLFALSEIGALRHDVQQERDERLAVSNRLDDHLTHGHPEGA